MTPMRAYIFDDGLGSNFSFLIKGNEVSRRPLSNGLVSWKLAYAPYGVWV